MDMRSKFGNPWSADEWNLTVQGQFVAFYGEERAKVFRRAAGVKLGATKPAVVVVKDTRTFIYTKRLVTADGTGQGIIGAGSSGDGPPEG